MEYTLRDVTGDGEEELLLGKNGSIYAIWTIWDGVTEHLEGGYPEGYLCADAEIRCRIYGQKEDRKAPNKKISMMRRWMVRDDGKVDLGVWKKSDKTALILPLDVHVHDQATALGLTARRQKDIVTAREITDAFMEIWPDDPCLGDFALFGYGVTHK